MSWQDTLKAGLSAIHFRNLRKAVAELSDTHSDILNVTGWKNRMQYTARQYREEIIELAITNFVEEIGEKPLRLKHKYNRMFDRVIARVVNSIRRERGIE